MPIESEATFNNGSGTHVAFIINNYPPKVGGVEQHVEALARSLVALNVKVTVVTLDRERVGTSVDGVKVIRLHATPTLAGVISWPRLGTTRALVRLLRAEGVTHISTHTRFFPMSFVGVRTARKLRIPAIHTEHGSDFVKGVSPLIGLGSRVIDYTLGCFVLRRTDSVLAISSSVQGFVRKLSGKDSHLFLNAIDTKRFMPRDPVSPGHRLVFLGRIVPGKGWERAIETAEVLSEEGHPVELHVIGNGPDMEKMKERVADSPVKESIHVHGFLGSDHIAALLRGGILINATVLSEGFQTTLLEAVASGAAVVSTPVTAAEYLASIGAAVRVTPDDTLKYFVSATKTLLLQGWEPPAAELVRQFDWSTRSRQYNDILRTVSNA